LLRNSSDKTAVDVGGQVSILDAHGRLVKSINPSPVTLLPHGEGVLLEEAIKLGEPLPNGRLKVNIAVTNLEPGGSSPVSFSDVRYSTDNSIGEVQCSLTGRVSNRFSETKQNLQLRLVGFAGAKIATAGLTYVDTVFPKTDATFEVTGFGPVMCPKKLSRIEVLPNLSEDKIFNP
jgi:hypothetical protein